jgi:hypothetical protein
LARAVNERRFCRYVRRLADSLGLCDWSFSITFDCDDEHASANITCIDGRKHADIRFAADLLTSHDPLLQRTVVTHELVHCHLASCQNIIRDDLVKHLSQSTYDALYDGFRRQLEYAVDGIAVPIARGLPLPDGSRDQRTMK